MAVKSPVVSTLNPNAPLFVPAAYVATEDFSPEWWSLVQTCPAFRDYWIRERFELVDEEYGELTVEDMEEMDAVDELVEMEELQIEDQQQLLHEDDEEAELLLLKSVNLMNLNNNNSKA